MSRKEEKVTKAAVKKNSADVFFQLTRRHFLVFFKNKVRVLYTLLVPVIIFAVYILFLRDLELMTVKNALYQLNVGISEGLLHHAGTVIDTWMLSGIMALSTITVSLQTNTVIVEDKSDGVNRDFISSPISKNLLIGSYFLFNYIVTALICILFYLICLIYLGCMNELVFPFAGLMTILAVLLYTTASSTLFTVFLCSFVKTEATMASIVSIFSTAVGFLMGAYMPLSMFPSWVQNLCGFFPGTYSCALLRYSFLSGPLNHFTDYVVNTLQLENATELIGELTKSFGYRIYFFGTPVDPPFQALAVAVFIALFAALNILAGQRLTEVIGARKKRNKKKRTASVKKSCP